MLAPEEDGHVVDPERFGQHRVRPAAQILGFLGAAKLRCENDELVTA